jgi:hypothetical protein
MILGMRSIRSLVGGLGLVAFVTAGLLSQPSATAAANGSTDLHLPQTSGLWLERSFSVALVNEPGLTEGTSPSASGAGDATITGSVKTWVNSTTECAGAKFNAVSFSNETSAAQWMHSGFATNPLNSGVDGICQDPESGLAVAPSLAELPSNGMTPIDVATLPRESSSLAALLVRKNTGLASLDQLAGISDPSTSEGFQRAALLLLAPRSGESLAFRLALLHALGKLPGVEDLGVETTHSGLRGRAFAAGRAPDAETVVVSTKTGELLEIRNMSFPSWAIEWLGVVLTSFDPDKYAMSNLFYPPISTEMHLSIQWIDVISPAHVVKSGVPSTLQFLPSA